MSFGKQIFVPRKLQIFCITLRRNIFLAKFTFCVPRIVYVKGCWFHERNPREREFSTSNLFYKVVISAMVHGFKIDQKTLWPYKECHKEVG